MPLRAAVIEKCLDGQKFQQCLEGQKSVHIQNKYAKEYSSEENRHPQM